MPAEGALKVFFILPSLHAGGAERFTLHLLANLDRSRFAPTLVLIQREGAFLSEIPADVPVIDLERTRVSSALVPLIKLIRRRKPDVVFSTMGYLNIICGIASCFVPSKIRFTAREASHPGKSYPREPGRSLFRLLYYVFYRRFSAIVAQTEMQRSVLVNDFYIPEKKITVIPNPVPVRLDKDTTHTTSVSPDWPIKLLAAGSLRAVKGFDLLLQALSLLPKRYFLTIAGSGGDKSTLQSLSGSLGIAERVSFPGFVHDLVSLMKQTDFFVLSSRFEGFPNVVLEALSVGTPVVAFSGDTAAGEILIDGFNGFLASPENPKDLARKIELAAHHTFDRAAIRKDTEERFGMKNIIRRYEAVLSGNKETGLEQE